MTTIAREPRSRLDLDTIKQENPLPAVVGTVVDLKRAGSEWKACCPFHNEKSPSFTIFKGGQRYYCFGCGAGGDVLDFVQRLHGVDLRGAGEMLSGGNLPTTHYAPLPPPDDASNRVEEAKAIWDAAQPAPGTLAERYLHHRAIRIAMPESIRFTALRYGKSGPQHPVLLAAVSSVDGQFIGMQRTYLNESGTGKAAVPKPKLSLGRVSGGAVRLSPPAASLVVCEGLEDGLSLQQELGKAVWVAAGASMLPAMLFPEMVRSVAVGGDNDDAGRAAANKSASAFAKRGLSTRMFFPIDAKDWNEALMKGSRI